MADDAKKKNLGFPRWELLNAASEFMHSSAGMNRTCFILVISREMHTKLADTLDEVDQTIERGVIDG